VKPYYLHHGDLAPGTSHLRTTIAEGRSLERQLRSVASGLCQPIYALDLPGGYGKVPLASCRAHKAEEGWLIEDARGVVHRYPHD
jgi:lysine 2,3-aminomutase